MYLYCIVTSNDKQLPRIVSSVRLNFYSLPGFTTSYIDLLLYQVGGLMHRHTSPPGTLSAHVSVPTTKELLILKAFHASSSLPGAALCFLDAA